ncbi:CHASE3 domain-containing protein [Geodermatophilus ruber]|uniref:Histidine kinase-, DNA gyrase B-, and HSP90-like ATPase n=1 Tax=Geodermatophilus ruber TaxID=504800 RepID=A0A1I4DEE0_9ACTN|nr:CHASE3 domain-containing protein [Geodermatophilus ruber]SFK91393.1 Histidine kinase-, DNA gyrase B-, and HSP90-like ATPase [Geodermatophilus ruber]
MQVLRRRPRPAGHTLQATVGVIVGALLVLIVLSAVATSLARAMVAAEQRELGARAVPAHRIAVDLTTSYLDQMTGQLSYLLTGDGQFLTLYEQGAQRAERLQQQLAALLAPDAEASAALAQLRAAGADWREQVAEPGIAARRQGALPADELVALTTAGRARFDELRGRLADVEQRTVELETAQLDAIGRMQTRATVVTVASAVLGVAVAVGVVPLLRRRLTHPLERLQADVQAVAAGDHDRTIARTGPRELATIAESVDRMRAGLVRSSRERLAAQHELTLRQEHDRLAADLHDLTIQRIFGLGLGLTSTARRHPALAPAVAPLIEETDRIIRELRTVIFDLGRPDIDGTDTLRGQVIDLTEASVRALGFTPTLEFAGPVDTLASARESEEVLAVLRETLSNVARHANASAASVRLAAREGVLTLSVADNGTGLPRDAPRGAGLGNLRDRAQRLGGSVRIRPGAAGVGTVVEWQVPLRPGPN